MKRTQITLEDEQKRILNIGKLTPKVVLKNPF